MPQIGRSSFMAVNMAARDALPFLVAIAACASKKLGERNASASAFDSRAFTRLYSSRSPAATSLFGFFAATQASAIACSSARSSSCATALSTRPAFAASLAVGFHPSAPSMRCAFCSPMMRAKLTLEQPSGTRPSAWKGVWKVAFSEATTPSPSVAEVTAAPIAGPLTPTKSGLGKSRNIANRAVFCATRSVCSADGHIGLLTIAPRSTPAQ
mmetsp:Transcript_48169/g.110672  ORF Transcript_48169/g.110672 Transcript_48169/m.110672 type:complete len:212 (+) Transcript_48169:332-967(+)